MIQVLDAFYKVVSPLILSSDAQTAHHRFTEILRTADRMPLVGWLPKADAPVMVGGVRLPAPLVLSAGLVKGDGFETEAAAVAAVDGGRNIIPGWRFMPSLVGAVEFGSYTRYPRVGNSGRVVWRDRATRSTQNRIGLKNPGAVAAAGFMSKKRDLMPAIYGINVAVSPGVSDPSQEKREAVEAVRAFVQRGVIPSWFTLNLSCPNTEDDPTGNQTAEKAEQLSAAVVQVAGDVPLWVKVSPCLSDEQYHALMTAFSKTGVRAVIATNTLGQPTPDGTATAGVGGGALHAAALDAVRSLAAARAASQSNVDIIGCGGVLDGASYQGFMQAGATGVMYYSALIYRSPLAAAIIWQEANS